MCEKPKFEAIRKRAFANFFHSNLNVNSKTHRNISILLIIVHRCMDKNKSYSSNHNPPRCPTKMTRLNSDWIQIWKSRCSSHFGESKTWKTATLALILNDSIRHYIVIVAVQLLPFIWSIHPYQNETNKFPFFSIRQFFFFITVTKYCKRGNVVR